MGPVSNGSGLISLLFTRDRSGTCLEWMQTDPKRSGPAKSRSSFGSVGIRSGQVPDQPFCVNTSIGSKQFHVNSAVRSGPVWFGTVPVRSRVNGALSTSTLNSNQFEVIGQVGWTTLLCSYLWVASASSIWFLT